jgi:hypothetical protein
MDAETKFSPRDDLFTVDENSQPLLVTTPSDVPLMVGVRGVSRPVSRNDVATIDALADGDVWWSLSAEDCATAPQVDQRLVEPNGQRWKIVTQPEIQTHGTRWKCAGRRLS